MQLLLFLQCFVSVPQVNVNTRSNYQAIEHVTAAAQENSAGAKAIEDMVVRIRTLAMEPERKNDESNGRTCEKSKWRGSNSSIHKTYQGF